MHRNCILSNKKLASCPWGPVTANGVDLLTKIYPIYMEPHIIKPKIMSVGPTVVAGEPVTDAKTEGRKARKYIMMIPYYNPIRVNTRLVSRLVVVRSKKLDMIGCTISTRRMWDTFHSHSAYIQITSALTPLRKKTSQNTLQIILNIQVNRPIESNFRAFQNLVSEHSVAGVPASLNNLAKSVPDPWVMATRWCCTRGQEISTCR